MKTRKIIIKTYSDTYPIFIGLNLISKFSSFIKKNSINFDQCLLVIDKNVPKKFIFKIKKSLKNKRCFLYYINSNEKNKNQKTIDQILDFLLKKKFFKTRLSNCCWRGNYWRYRWLCCKSIQKRNAIYKFTNYTFISSRLFYRR